jgi:hypothetical protein
MALESQLNPEIGNLTDALQNLPPDQIDDAIDGFERMNPDINSFEKAYIRIAAALYKMGNKNEEQ